MSEELKLILSFLGSGTVGAIIVKAIDFVIARANQEANEERDIRNELREENKALKARERELMDQQRAYFEAELEKNRKIHALEIDLEGMREELGKVKELVAEMQALNRMLMARLDDNLLQMAVESAPDALIIYDLEGRYLYVNSFVCHLAGLTDSEMLGKLPAELPADVGTNHFLIRLAEELPQAMEADQPIQGREAVQTANGRRVLEYSLWCITDRRGSPYAVGCIARDITNRNGRSNR